MAADAKHIRFTAVSRAHLTEMRAFVQNAAEAFGGTPDAVYDLLVATNEAITNIIKHGYPSQQGDIEITVSHHQQQLIIILRDRGQAFDPTTFPKPDVTLPLEARTPVGLGVHMMRSFTDQISYEVTPDGENELILVKHNAIRQKK